MDISLIVPLKFLKLFIHVGETLMEGSVSQNFDLDLSFLLYVENSTLQKKRKNLKSYPFFLIK